MTELRPQAEQKIQVRRVRALGAFPDWEKNIASASRN
jgi:hypothetical protein